MAIPIAVAAGTADVLAYTGAGVLFGWSARETVGTATAAISVRDGITVAGPIIAEVGLVAGGMSLGVGVGVTFQAGLFVDRSLTGTSAIVLYVSED